MEGNTIGNFCWRFTYFFVSGRWTSLSVIMTWMKIRPHFPVINAEIKGIPPPISCKCMPVHQRRVNTCYICGSIYKVYKYITSLDTCWHISWVHTSTSVHLNTAAGSLCVIEVVFYFQGPTCLTFECKKLSRNMKYEERRDQIMLHESFHGKVKGSTEHILCWCVFV